MPALVQIPESAGPVCITYNLPELKVPLKLSGTTLAGIYLGKIKSWQDPAVKTDNPGVNLPAHDIVVAHRSDGSGTTNIFTTCLAKISPEWQNQVGKGVSVNWPTGLGSKGSEGVTGVVKQTPGGSYVELTYATENRLPVVSVMNQAGSWVQPTAAGTTAADQRLRGGARKRRSHAHRGSPSLGERWVSDLGPDLSSFSQAGERPEEDRSSEAVHSLRGYARADAGAEHGLRADLSISPAARRKSALAGGGNRTTCPGKTQRHKPGTIIAMITLRTV
jgi:hypothetical protein